ncbi:MAG: Crp/Fnr family transcriptional regulator [Gammaproteobacteria bacterium]|nr:Crp/Fnr family transcriptional regulator [Gammaproteobacteria bacterium]MDH5801846.1 Crp/Fnr family transcriptional regulator [Gammaproteobacteria bacterium]
MKPIEKKLLKLFNRLAGPERDMLLGFAEYLVTRGGASSEKVVEQPNLIPRPEQESVVAALKRLTASYPMLDDPGLLNEGSALMSQHVMQGRDAVEVIDELEAMFRRHYETYLAQMSGVMQHGSEEGAC